MRQKTEELSLDLNIEVGLMEACIVGVSGMLHNRMSEKAKHELLLPHGMKTRADKASKLKHDVLEEFRNSPYVLRDPKAETYLAVLACSFKKAMVGAAGLVPGAEKKMIGQLVWIEGERLNLWGIPQLSMMVVRQKGIDKTPDIRTRAITPEWATRLKIRYVQPHLNAKSIATLLATAGLTQGIGDGRNEKGSMTYGQFAVVDQDDERFKRIIKTGGRKTQAAAMDDPTLYDAETEEMYGWFQQEVERRGKQGQLKIA